MKDKKYFKQQDSREKIKCLIGRGNVRSICLQCK
jgi:hypothetical protein